MYRQVEVEEEVSQDRERKGWEGQKLSTKVPGSCERHRELPLLGVARSAARPLLGEAVLERGSPGS